MTSGSYRDDASQLPSDWQCGRDLLWGNMTNVASRPSGELLVEGLVDRSLQESSTKEESELALQQCSERSEKLAAGHNVVPLRFAQCTGLHPVYDLPRQVALRYVGTQVLQPASLRFALAQASQDVKWSASGDGRAFVSSGLAVEEEDTLEHTLEKHTYLGVFN
eukprot:symbB.v1.2.038474.t1/scaffold6006.1/size21840/2